MVKEGPLIYLIIMIGVILTIDLFDCADFENQFDQNLFDLSDCSDIESQFEC